MTEFDPNSQPRGVLHGVDLEIDPQAGARQMMDATIRKLGADYAGYNIRLSSFQDALNRATEQTDEILATITDLAEAQAYIDEILAAITDLDERMTRLDKQMASLGKATATAK